MSLGFTLGLTDFFCGAGGSSRGAVDAGVEVVSAANHWDKALETHQLNHPGTRHYEADLLSIEPDSFPYTPIAWFSPECTTHSRGRGKSVLRPIEQLALWEEPDPSDVRSRVTMWQVVRFTAHHRYEVVIVENVVDIKYWPPLSLWFKEMSKLGYDWKTCYLNSMFFHPLNGQAQYAPQSRDRWYTVFWKQGNHAPDLELRPLAWCHRCEKDVRAVQVFKKPVFPQGLYDNTGKRGQYYYACPNCRQTERTRQPGRVEPYYFAAWNAIDWSIDTPKICEREALGLQPLKAKTLRRIEIGLERYGRQPLVVELAHAGKGKSYAKSTDFPLPTQTTAQTLAFIVPRKAQPKYVHAYPADRTLPTLTTIGAPSVLVVEEYNNGSCRPSTDPLNTVTAGGVKSGLLLLPDSFVFSYYNRDNNQSSLDAPLPTIPCDNRFALVMPQTPFIASYYGCGDCMRPVTEPLATLTGKDRHAFVVNEQADNRPTSIDEPLQTILTGNHKYLAQPDEFDFDIDQCRFRMLEPDECKVGQGFRGSYVILGTKSEQVKQIGGAVSPPTGEYLAAAARDSLC